MNLFEHFIRFCFGYIAQIFMTILLTPILLTMLFVFPEYFATGMSAFLGAVRDEIRGIK